MRVGGAERQNERRVQVPLGCKKLESFTAMKRIKSKHIKQIIVYLRERLASVIGSGTLIC